MRRAALAALLVAVGAVGSWLAIGALRDLDRVYSEHPDLGSVPEAGLTWLPGWLPEDAVDLRMAHDIDTNEAWTAFRVPAGSDFAPACGPASAEEVAALHAELSGWTAARRLIAPEAGVPPDSTEAYTIDGADGPFRLGPSGLYLHRASG